MTTEETARCRTCAETDPWAFYVNKSLKTGLSPQCKRCTLASRDNDEYRAQAAASNARRAGMTQRDAEKAARRRVAAAKDRVRRSIISVGLAEKALEKVLAKRQKPHKPKLTHEEQRAKINAREAAWRKTPAGIASIEKSRQKPEAKEWARKYKSDNRKKNMDRKMRQEQERAQSMMMDWTPTDPAPPKPVCVKCSKLVTDFIASVNPVTMDRMYVARCHRAQRVFRVRQADADTTPMITEVFNPIKKDSK